MHMGDICFVEIQTTFKMHAVSFRMFLQFVEKESFNPRQSARGAATVIPHGYTPCLHPRPAPHRHRACGDWQRNSKVQEPLRGHALHRYSDFPHPCTVLAIERDKPTPKCRVYMMLIGNYGGHMAFAMDPPYCAHICCGIQTHRQSFQNDISRTFQPRLHYDSRQHGGAEAIVCGQLGPCGKEIDYGGGTFSSQGVCSLVPGCFRT